MTPGGALFNGLCRFWAIEVREPQDVADFYLPELDLFVIIETPAWDRKADARTVRSEEDLALVLHHSELDLLRSLSGRTAMMGQLVSWASQQNPRRVTVLR